MTVGSCYTIFPEMENREKTEGKKKIKNNHFSNLVKSYSDQGR